MQGLNKTAVIFGGSGAIGAAVARKLACQGVQVHLVARGADRLGRIVDEIRASGGSAQAHQADVLDQPGLAATVARLAHAAGGIDIAVNATSFLHDQGTALDELSSDAFAGGFSPLLMAGFNIAKAVAPQMGGTRPGVILTLNPPAGPMAMPGHLGHIVGCAGVEALSRALAGELGPRNIRVLCLRSHAIPEAVAAGSYTGALFGPKAAAMGISTEDWLSGAAAGTLLKRLPTLAQVAETVAFLASDHAGAMTGAVINVTAGATID